MAIIARVPPEQRGAWRQWVANEIGGDSRQIDRITDAIVGALIEGQSVSDAIALARHLASGGPGPAASAYAGDVPDHPISDSNHLRGRVKAFRQRSELMMSTRTYGPVWDFRVESWDADNRPEPPVSVELRGGTISGSIAEGDWVEIKGRWKAGGVLRPSTVWNVTTNAPVLVGYRGRYPVLTALYVVVFVLFLLVVIGFMVFVATKLFGSG